ncbi:MAG: cytochrome c biogenesis protein DipZ [Spirochaetales bacterium]|nr:cytochrome c biogenesis protein DipZ [Spirochaetales bacterium]
MTVLTFFAFLSGIVTILSPCILPVLPLVLSGSVGGKRKPFGVVVGFIASFSLFTLTLSALVQALNIAPDTMRIVALVIIIGFGTLLVIPPLQKKFELLASKMVGGKRSSGKSGFTGGLLVGASLGLIWTPCVGPIMASVIGLAVSQQVDGGAVLIVIAYALGTALPMLGIMFGGRGLLNRFPRLTSHTDKIQRVFGVLMIGVGLSIAFGWDRQFQTFILRTFPNYGTSITAIENNSLIQEALSRRSGELNKEEPVGHELSWDNPPKNAKLGDFGAAPEIVTDGKWLNSEPLTMDDLKGKVVLLDFWTYSCVNCVRTMPYLKDWYEKYGDQGFEIIGFHAPEFAFERDVDNLASAMEDLGVSWPVVQDNSFDQWRAYNNRYWPAHYFIDARGRIRYFHFGEGEYENSEKVIRKLLKEAGYEVETGGDSLSWEGIDSKTSEIYLGYERSEGFSSAEFEKDRAVSYSHAEDLENGQWSLEGKWIIRDDFIQVDSEGSLRLGFYSKDLFLVIEPLEESSEVQVYLDDKSVQTIRPTESKLYQLLDLPEAGSHTATVKVKGATRFYAFTFG